MIVNRDYSCPLSNLHDEKNLLFSFFYGSGEFSDNIPRPFLQLGLTWQITYPLQVHQLQLIGSGVYFFQHLYTLPEKYLELNIFVEQRAQETFDHSKEIYKVIPEKQQEQELIGDGCGTAFGVSEQIPILSSRHLSVNDTYV